MSLSSVDGIIMFPKISDLVKEAKKEGGDKCTFGVYTKWDKFKKKQKKKKAGNVPVDVEYSQIHKNQQYLEKVYGKNKTAPKAREDEEVFFVDVGGGETFNVSILITIRSNIVII